MNIHENIKVLRLQKRLSQLDVAEGLSITQGTYAQLESGKTEITLNRLEQLAKLFGMTLIEILQYGGGVEKPQIVVDSEKVKELEREIKDLKEKLELMKENSKYKNDLIFRDVTLKSFLREDYGVFIEFCKEMTKASLDYEKYYRLAIDNKVNSLAAAAKEFYSKNSKGEDLPNYVEIFKKDVYGWHLRVLLIDLLESRLELLTKDVNKQMTNIITNT